MLLNLFEECLNHNISMVCQCLMKDIKSLLNI